MATVTVTLSNICAGGEHLTFTVTGDKTATVDTDISKVTGAITDEEIVAFVKGLIKIGKIGRTNAQLRTLFQAGVVVTV